MPQSNHYIFQLNISLLSLVLTFSSCNSNTRINEIPKNQGFEIPELLIDTVVAGKGIKSLVIGQDVKKIIKKLGKPTEVFSREDAKKDKIFHPVSDTTDFLPYYFDFDTVYHFRNENIYGLAHIYSKMGKALVINFSYIFDDGKGRTKVNGVAGYFDETDSIKKELGQPNLHFTPKEDTLFQMLGVEIDVSEHLYYFDKGMSFYINNGEMLSFTIFPPTNRRKFEKLVNHLSTK